MLMEALGKFDQKVSLYEKLNFLFYQVTTGSCREFKILISNPCSLQLVLLVMLKATDCIWKSGLNNWLKSKVNQIFWNDVIPYFLCKCCRTYEYTVEPKQWFCNSVFRKYLIPYFFFRKNVVENTWVFAQKKITEYKYRLIQPFRFIPNKSEHKVWIVLLGYNVSRKFGDKLSPATTT